MRDLITVTIFFLLYSIPSIHSHAQQTATLEIRFTGISSSKGSIAIGINNSPDGWPRQPQLHADWKKENLSAGVFVRKLDNLPYGTYAISVLDDENSNLEMDMVMGIPREGWGFSMNPGFRLTAPKFEECSFLLDKPFQQITIHLRYAGKGK